MNALDFYIGRFRKLKVNRNKQKGNAPHKPVLLLAVIRGIEERQIKSNRIYITPWLVSTFKSIWSGLVHSAFYKPDFSLPFYHMQSEPFWKLIAYPGYEIPLTSSLSIRSFAGLKASVEYAEIDEALYILLSQPATREILRNDILQHWFQANVKQYQAAAEPTGLFNYERRILEEPHAVYISVDDTEEDFVRDGAFKSAVLTQYNFTCSISGLRIDTTDNIQMLDACHIEPWRISHNDSIHNGFALCPNLHRAFDRHLIYVDDDYKVRCRKDRFTETSGESYGILQFEGKQLLLPRNRKYWPDVENFRRQRNH